MDNVDPTYSDNSDHEINEALHSNLLAAVSQLDRKQRVKPPSRKESSFQVSEFHLGKSGATKNAVLIRNLTKSLDQQGSHAVITRQLRSVHRKARTLPRPLEKPVAARIQRTVGFRNVKTQLARWDAVVYSSRAADQLTFPLKQSTVNFQTTDDFISKLKSQTRTPLEQQMDEILNNSPAVQEERKDEEEYKLTLAEMRERRREMAKLRAQQSYMAAKASRQKKIKSKKYHRILRHERIRQQLKDFEVLQKTDPEAALQQLEQLERTRAEERVSLRHRSTGQWARNKAVRAKYDKESRQELAQQLAVSRDLTQKINIESSSDDEEEEENNGEKVVPADSDNPWIAPKKSTEVDEFVSAYRKYWEEHNKKSLGQAGTVNNNTNHNEGTEEREVGNEIKKGHPGKCETACADRNFESENDKSTPADKINLGSHTSESLSAGGEDNKDGLIATYEEQRCNSSKHNQTATPDKQHCTFSRTEMQPKMKTLSQSKENITTGQLCNNMEILPNVKILAPCKQECTEAEVNNGTAIQPQKRKLTPNKQKYTAQQETSITGLRQQNKTFSLSDRRSMAEQENDSTEHVLQGKISPNNEMNTEEQKNFSIDRQTERMTLSPNQQKNISEEVNIITQVQQERKNVSQNKPVIVAEQLNSNKKKTKFGISSDSCIYKPFESHSVVTSTTNSWVVTPIDVEVGTVGEVNGLGGKKNKRNRRKSVESRAVKSKVKIGELFDEMEEKLKEKVGTKLKKLKVELKVKDENKAEETNSDSDNEGPSLKLKQMHVRPHLDEELVEQPHDKVQEEGSLNLNLSKTVAESRVQEEVQAPPVDNIDPNKFIAMKPRHLQTELPDMVTRDEAIDDSEDESTERQMTITEAFAEDDVVAEFRKEKEEVTDKSQPQSVDMSLPGWGEWGGKNIPVSSRKKRRFIIKFPEVARRKDANKGSVIINEDKNDRVVTHQVSELPFPFTSVKDFEASIRAPIGNTWIPETAHRTLIKAPLVSKLGTIIKPMDEDMLVNKKKKIKGMP